MHWKSTQRRLPLKARIVHGGRRPGAGRKPRGVRAGVSHAQRPAIRARHPVHVTMRVLPHVPSLRGREPYHIVRAAIALTSQSAIAIVHFSVLGNHLHLIVEADSNGALSRGMQGLAIRIAKRLNAHLGRRGPVFADRYHARVLRTPAEVRRALAYVLLNQRSHRARLGQRVGPGSIDPCSSGDAFDGWRDAPAQPSTKVAPPATAPPRSWLLALGWRRHGLLSVSEVPARARGGLRGPV